MPSRAAARSTTTHMDIEDMAVLFRRRLGDMCVVQPVGIIGPGDGGARECEAAYEVGRVLGHAGVPIVCGGRGGVMQAAAQGAWEAGGVAVGILPEDDLRNANPYLTLALPTGIGEMRNALIARSSVCLVAIGGGLGTLSEMALGLKWGKPVFTLYEEIRLPEAKAATSTGEILHWVLESLVSGEPRGK